MEKKGTMRCDCGGHFVAQSHDFQGLQAEALMCSSCGNVTLTKSQAQKLIELQKMQTMLEGNRKIIRIGNSFGVTFPEKMRSFGIREGRRIQITPLTSTSFKIAVK